MSAAYAIAGEVLAPEPLGRAAVVVRDGRIESIVRSPRAEDLPFEIREVGGYICPGFIDLQINGSFGVDVGPEPEGLAKLARLLPETGTTAFLPTLISSPKDRYAAFLDAVREASRSGGASIPGAHLEGPFLCRARKGAHDPGNLRDVDPGIIKGWVDSGLVRVVTLAPELPGATEAIRLLHGGSVIASAGHTDASYEEVARAIDSGLASGTHLYNAMSPLSHRSPGTVGALLDDERVRAGIVADGIHVHEAALRIAYRQKGADGLFLVTDAMQAAGMEAGEYELNGRRVRLEDGAVRLEDGTLAGSALTMDRAVRNAREFLRCGLEDAVRMATRTPAEALGLENKGRIAPGADADLTVLDEKGEVLQTIVAGRTVYEREGSP